MMIDTIGDFLTRLRNACGVRKEYVDAIYSGVNEAIAKILKEEGFIEGYEVREVPFKRAKKPGSARKVLRVFLKYTPDNKEVIHGIKRVSKPGRRIQVSRNEIPLVKAGLGIAILSTDRGIIQGYRARELGVGGEVLCYVW